MPVDTIAELTGVPAATPTIKTAIMWLYMALRNLTQRTASEYRVAKDDGTIIAEADVSDDATTFAKSKFRAAD